MRTNTSRKAVGNSGVDTKFFQGNLRFFFWDLVEEANKNI